LDLTERDRVASQFGVASAQIERDYVLSLLLSALARQFADEVIFFGGTALSRTYLPLGRLSEDLDLIAVGARRDLAARLDSALPRALLRGYGRLTWQPALSGIRDIEPASLVDGRGLIVKVQLLKSDGYPSWPTEVRSLDQRYHDVPPAVLRVPTLAAFAAWKTVAWCDRRAPRDLWDLWALAQIGAIDADAAELYRRYGPTRTPSDQDFRSPPSEEDWVTQLGQQTKLEVAPSAALDVVRRHWAVATGAA
jgi:hypothetical protein